MKFFLVLLLGLSFLAGGWILLSNGYRLLVEDNISQWHAKKVVVVGIEGPLYEKIGALVRPFQGHPFSAEQGLALRQKISQQYPMLKQVTVKRGLLRGTLTVSAVRRVPVAQFKLSDGSIRYIDTDRTVYTDAGFSPSQQVLPVELEGPVPEKLSVELIELVQSALKLRKELDFSFLRMNLTANTVKMYMPDGSVIDFGPSVQLKNKAARAAQILTLSREKYPAPFVLDFRFFENGKVFLTQQGH